MIVFPLIGFLTAYSVIPENITVTKGETVDFDWGITASADTGRVKFLNFIPIKTVRVSVVPRYYVIPSGEAIGVKIYSDGVLVVDTATVRTDNGTCEPGKAAGLMPGDRIIAADGEKIENTDDFIDKVNHEKPVKLSVIRNNSLVYLVLKPEYSPQSQSYKAGLWVRDSAAGIGTLTFYDPQKQVFAALGHGICDSDTKELITAGSGSINGCRIRGVIKGEKGTAGELLGDFSGRSIGEISKNTVCGIYGDVNGTIDGQAVPVASRFETKEGKAEILCDIDGTGPKAYEIEITKVSKTATAENKGIVLCVKDQRLLNRTGGIVQGMSGSPILQNGKIVGAVTHVFVNDPTKGYGIFIENMLDISMKTE